MNCTIRSAMAANCVAQLTENVPSPLRFSKSDGKLSVVHIDCTGAGTKKYWNCRGCSAFKSGKGKSFADVAGLRAHGRGCTKCKALRETAFEDRILEFPAAIGPDVNSMALLAVLVRENFRVLLLVDNATGLSCISFTEFLDAVS